MAHLAIYDQPEFLLCEIPIKDNTHNDHRLWIYHRLSLSLIEFVDMSAVNVDGIDAGTDFTYKSEKWRGVYVQNNTEVTDNDPADVMQRAWEYLRNYFIWEDSRIEEDDEARNN